MNSAFRRHVRFLLAWLLCLPWLANSAETNRLNIVFILADDLGYSDLGCYGGEIQDIAKYRDNYLDGSDAMRAAQFARQKETGITSTTLSALEREVGPPDAQPGVLEKLGPSEVNRSLPWNELNDEQRRFQATKMPSPQDWVRVLENNEKK